MLRSPGRARPSTEVYLSVFALSLAVGLGTVELVQLLNVREAVLLGQAREQGQEVGIGQAGRRVAHDEAAAPGVHAVGGRAGGGEYAGAAVIDHLQLDRAVLDQ